MKIQRLKNGKLRDAATGKVLKLADFGPKKLNLKAYLDAFKAYPSHKGITGGTIHDFLKESKIKYYGGRNPIYQIEHFHNGQRAVIGGTYASNGKPKLVVGEDLDF